MKKIGLLLAVAAVLSFDPGDPSEAQIQTAFAAALSNPLRGVLIAGPDTASGTLLHGNTTEIRALRKLGCARAPVAAYVCDFYVDLRTGDDAVRRTVSGYFLDGPGALTFARQIYDAPSPVRVAAF